MSRPLPKRDFSAEIQCGTMSKREAAQHIGQGIRHIHSSKSPDKDLLYQSTVHWLETGILQPFSWESERGLKEVWVHSSVNRYKTIQKITQDVGKGKSSIKQHMEGTLEELVTNAIYHGYRNKDGSEKFSRNQDVNLSDKEKILIRYRPSAHGLYLSVTDRGGNLCFDEVANTFLRCYNSSSQIEAKEGGAGLGMYMVFESVTHLKIVRERGKQTIVSCWIADKKTYDPTTFSFNFFERK